jgi:squalene-associated FAD-dependent desaturase
MNNDVIVIGSGLSGLSAAVDLCRRGRRVLVLERDGRLGGRAYSFRDRMNNAVVDNGQHLLMGCFHNTRRFLSTIGTSDQLSVQGNLAVTFYYPRLGLVRFRCPNLPAPLHILIGLLRLKSLSLRDRFRLLSVLREVASHDGEGKNLDSLTVDEWLVQCGQTEDCRNHFWNIVATATLNEEPKQASAKLFVKVLREAFLKGSENSVLMIPKVGLSDLYVGASLRFIRRHGGDVLTNRHVRRLAISEAKAKGVELKNGDLILSRTVISTVPLADLLPLIPVGTLFQSTNIQDADSVSSSPIITINLWLDRSVLEEEFVSLLDSPIQWVFNKSKIFSDGTNEGSYLSCVISGAREFVSWQKDELVRLALDELAKPFPAVRSAQLLHSLVIKEKRATLSSSPAMLRFRLPPNTPWENFFLAGDWVDTGLPSTIESAVTSGFNAARLADEYLSNR